MPARIRLRANDPPRHHADVLIHMGTGDPSAVLVQALRTYEDYEQLASELRMTGCGIFTVSVFALVDGVTREMVFDAMPQKQFGSSTFSAVRHRFTMLPTSIEIEDGPEDLRLLQRAHFDVVLRPPRHLSLDGRLVAELDAKERDALIEALRPELVNDLLPLFEPRTRKYP